MSKLRERCKSSSRSSSFPRRLFPRRVSPLYSKNNAAPRSNLLNISQLAFRTCVHTFVHHQLTDKEEKCIAAVGKKFIASSLRATARLAEAQALEVSAQRREMEARLRELKTPS